MTWPQKRQKVKGANMAAKTESNKTFFAIKGMKIANVRRLSEKVIAFSLLGNGLGLYNMRIVSSDKGEFVASPQEKGKDGKYYAVYAVYLANDDQKKIIEAVKKQLPAEPETDDFIPF